MRPRLYLEMFRRENSYWWDISRRTLVCEEIKKFSRFSSKHCFLDAGCGAGLTLSFLQKKLPGSLGWDLSAAALRFCRKRGLANIRRVDLEKPLPGKDSRFDAIVCLEVLEHIRNDRQLVFEFSRCLAPGGRLFITVPAYQFLWTAHDQMLSHKRRYRRSVLAGLLQESGLKIKRATYYYSFLLPAAVIFKLIGFWSRQRRSDSVEVSGPANHLLLAIAAAERRVMELFPLPFGSSVFLVAEKPMVPANFKKINKHEKRFPPEV